MKLTTKQKEILALIVQANPYGPIDFDQLIERLSYTPTKDSMHFSMRALVAKDLILKGNLEPRRGRQRRLFTPTPLGLHWCAAVCPKPPPLALAEVLDDKELDKMASELGLA